VLLDSRRRRRTFLVVFLGSAVAQTLVATATFGARTTGRIAGEFVNPNHFAGYLEIAFACALAVLWREVLLSRDRGAGVTDRGENVERRLLPLALAALLVGTLGTGIGLTKSRGGIAAAVLMTLVVVALGMSHRRVRRRTRLAVLGIVMVVIAFLFIAITAKEEPILRYLESDPREIGADTRVLLWRTSLDAWRAFPVLGSGLGTFREAYRGVQPREIGQLVEQAHSDPLQLLVTGGAVGFLLGLAALVSCLTLLVRAYRSQAHREESAWILGGIGALVVLAIHGLVEFNFSIPAIPATLACVVGFAASATGRVTSDASDE
jgi:O-antigen ligase